MPPLLPGFRLPRARRRVVPGVAILRPAQMPPFRPPGQTPRRVAKTPRSPAGVANANRTAS